MNFIVTLYEKIKEHKLYCDGINTYFIKELIIDKNVKLYIIKYNINYYIVTNFEYNNIKNIENISNIFDNYYGLIDEINLPINILNWHKCDLYIEYDDGFINMIYNNTIDTNKFKYILNYLSTFNSSIKLSDNRNITYMNYEINLKTLNLYLDINYYNNLGFDIVRDITIKDVSIKEIIDHLKTLNSDNNINKFMIHSLLKMLNKYKKHKYSDIIKNINNNECFMICYYLISLNIPNFKGNMDKLIILKNKSNDKLENIKKIDVKKILNIPYVKSLKNGYESRMMNVDKKIEFDYFEILDFCKILVYNNTKLKNFHLKKYLKEELLQDTYYNVYTDIHLFNKIFFDESFYKDVKNIYLNNISKKNIINKKYILGIINKLKNIKLISVIELLKKYCNSNYDLINCVPIIEEITIINNNNNNNILTLYDSIMKRDLYTKYNLTNLYNIYIYTSIKPYKLFNDIIDLLYNNKVYVEREMI